MRVHAVCVAFALTVAIAEPALAQEQSGQIIGRVLTEGGVPAAGVGVVADGRSILGSHNETTDASGYFRLPTLPVGSYRLRLSFVGYRPVALDSVVVMLGRTTTIGEVTLQAQVYELGEIVVRAEQALVDVASAATATNLSSEQFKNLPTDRNFRSIVSLAPQANLSFLPQDEVNIAGGTGPENAYFLDGMNITDPQLGSTSSNLPYNFVRELQVKADGYEAEYGKATGGIINVITPSGGDRFSGQLFGYFTGNDLSASPRFALETAKEGHFSNYDFGGSIGGPIVRQSLWFFAAYNPSFQRQRVELPNIELPDESHTQHLFATKLSWRAGSETDVTLMVHGDPGRHRRLLLARVPVQTILSADAITESNTETGTVISGLVRHSIGTRTRIELSLASLSHGSDFESPTEHGRTEPSFFDLGNSTFSGGFGAFQHKYRERRSARASLATALARHELKLGVEYEQNRYDEFTDASADPGSPQGFIRRDDDTTFFWNRTKTDLTVKNRVPTIYLQDSWQVSDRLVLNLGVRWDAQYLTSARGVSAQSFTGEWQPRLGVIYRVGDYGGHKVFGSFGRFYEQAPLNLSVLYYNDATNAVLLHFDHDPRLDTSGADTVSQLYQPQIAPRQDINGQYYDEFTLGYEGTISSGFRLGLRGVARRLRWAIEDAFNPESGRFELGNPGRGNLGFLPRARRNYSALILTLEKPRGRRFNFMASYVLSRSRGNYEGLYDFEQGFPFPNTTLAFDFLELDVNSSGVLPNDRPHVVKFSGSYRFDSGLTVGTVASWASGMPRNEFGATPIGYPYNVFLQPRGSVGRTPSVFDLNFRLAYTLPTWKGGVRPRVSLDLFHLTNSRTTIKQDDVHYLGLDANGNQGLVNPGFNRGLLFQPPMSARLGVTLDFGEMP
jgi:hypothetical protein